MKLSNLIFFVLAILFFLLPASGEVKAVNILPNGSFEILTAPDVPDCWDQYLGPKKIKNWYNLWLVDRETAYHGKASMKLVTPSKEYIGALELKPHLKTKFARRQKWEIPKKGKIYTLSMYLKSDRPRFRVQIRTTKAHELVVGKYWKRYKITGEFNQNYNNLLSVSPNDVGILWIDAVQLEEGDTASEFEQSPNDKKLHPMIVSKRIKAVEGVLREYKNSRMPDLTVFPDRSFYTGEKLARISIRFRGDERYWQGKELTLEINAVGEKETQPVFMENQKVSRAVQVFQVPTSKLSIGAYCVSARLMDDGMILLESGAVLWKLAPAEHEVKIDHKNRRILVDGREFFFFAASFMRVHKYMGRLHRLFDELKVQGYTAVIASFSCRTDKTRASVADILYFFNLARQYGLKVVVWINPNAVEDKDGFSKLKKFGADIVLKGYKREIEYLMPIVRDHDALLAWYLCDEPGAPELINSDFTSKIMEFARALDPYHPHYVNYGNLLLDFKINQGKLPGDIISRTQYPVPVRPVTDVALWTELEYLAGQGAKPVTLWLQFASNKGRYSTPEEMTAMIYLAAIHGATGFQTWPIMPGSRVLWEHTKTLIAEMKELAPVLYASRVEQVMEADKQSVHHTARFVGDKLYVLAVNPSDKPIKAIISVPKNASGEAEVLFESRTVKLDDEKRISDKFQAFDRHVYVMRLHKE